MTRLADLPTPALLLDLDILERNLDRMATRTATLGVDLRPHAKTHKCVEVARLQREHGARGLTVATLAEAEIFAAGGFDDLTWAFPLIPSRLPQARELAREITLRLTVDSPEAITALEAAGAPFHVWLEVDCGDHRSGVDPGSERAVELARRLAGSPQLTFDGLLTHSGQAYGVRGREALARVAEEERRVMVALAERLRGAGLPCPAVSVGSTPAMSAVEDLTGATEARPGNYVFYDLSQVAIGSAGVADCAVTVLTTVVSHQPGADHSVIDAGALALSKDHGPGSDYGRACREPTATPLVPELPVTAVSQEHGTVEGELAVGSRLRILPNHSCLTVACWDTYHVVRGDRVVDRWPIRRTRG